MKTTFVLNVLNIAYDVINDCSLLFIFFDNYKD